MSLFKKIILLIIFVILFYILFRLIQKRTDILRVMNKDKSIIEGLSCISDVTNTTVKKILDANSVGQITDNLSSKNYYNDNHPISKYHIKASFNSGFNGIDITKDMLLYVLYRGYRFLHFEIYYDLVSGKKSETKTAVVSYKDSSITANTNMPLKDMLDIINLHAFSNVNNKDDPLFIQLTPVYNMPLSSDNEEDKNKKIGENTQFNTQIEAAMSVINDSYRYNGPLTFNTPMNSLLKKTIIIMDNVSNPFLNIKSAKLISMINIQPSDMTLCNAESKLEECNKNNQTLIQVKPTDSSNQALLQNPDALNIISKTSCNICPMMAWMSSYIGGFSSAGLSQLGEYETMFLKTGGSAFVLLSEAKSYSTLNNPSKVNGSQYP
jgi:hypothetical protein